MPFIQANKNTRAIAFSLPLFLLAAVSLAFLASSLPLGALAQTTNPELRPPLKTAVSAKSIRSDTATAVKMARMRWLDKMVTADPGLVAAICSHAASARVLAAHPHLDKIAEADHYTCRRITKWGSAAIVLTKNPQALRVVTLDPEGIYRAIKHDRSIAKRLTKNANFNQMVVENPDLGKLLANYM
ncbi:hypothetical protein BH11CYA1_BH11CYA1_26770 [soil metagenome]